MLVFLGLLAMMGASAFVVSNSSADDSEDERSDSINEIEATENETSGDELLESFDRALSISAESYFLRPSIDGGHGPDTLEGTEGNDVLRGLEDDDEIFGLDGADTIYGGSGSDIVVSDGGNDIVFGENDDDALHGREGQDTLFGGNGNDSLFGGSGNDVIIGGPGQDFLNGGEDNDVLIAKIGDSLHGGNGEDLLVIDAVDTVDHGEPAELIDFDRSEDRLVFIVDDPDNAYISVVESIENPRISHIQLNGQIVATVLTEMAPDPTEVEIWSGLMG